MAMDVTHPPNKNKLINHVARWSGDLENKETLYCNTKNSMGGTFYCYLTLTLLVWKGSGRSKELIWTLLEMHKIRWFHLQRHIHQLLRP